MTIGIYVALIIVVIGYTTYVGRSVRAFTSEEELTNHIRSTLATALPTQRPALVEQMQARAPELAEAAVVQMTDTLILLVEAQIGGLDGFAGTAVSSVESELVPAFRESLDHNADTIRTNDSEIVDAASGL